MLILVSGEGSNSAAVFSNGGDTLMACEELGRARIERIQPTKKIAYSIATGEKISETDEPASHIWRAVCHPWPEKKQ
jgi:hypothetical protein